MALLLLVGAFCAKRDFLSEESTKSLSKIVLQIVNPAVIFTAYLRERDRALMVNLLWALGLSALVMVVGILVARVVLHSKEPDQVAVERLSAVYSNCGFMGIPLVNALLGSTGVFYLTAFITIFNLFIWTHGVISISGIRDFKLVVKILKSPSIVAIFLGLMFFFIEWSVPDVIKDALTHLSNTNTPLAMLVAGATIARTDLRRAIGRIRVYFVAAVKLLVMPALSIAILWLMPVCADVKTTIVIAMGAPSAVTCTLFTINYKKDADYAASLFAITTLLSVLTLPLVGVLLSFGKY